MTWRNFLKTGRALACVAAACAAMSAAGCSAGPIYRGEATLSAKEDSAAFLDRMSSARTVTENDALRGMLLLVDAKDDCTTFADRVQKVRSEKLVAAEWDFDAHRPLTRGKLAYMVYQACRIQGGVMLAVAGPSQRYCLRELQYRGVMTEGSALMPVSGMELVAILTRADICRKTGRVPDPVGETN